ncbi:MAG: ATP-binding cassette domain-containing protein, partial [Flavobacterium sp.]|nr:ATP-binding cassette domain-containing protein [Flavobacterium sp.]
MLTVQSISFSYANAITLNAIDFTLEKGKILALIGESGCGKSTLLKLIYGLHDTDEGQIFWNDKKIYGPKNYLVPGMEFIKYLAQDFDLMPYITVAENVGKFLSNVDIKKKTDRIKELLDVVDL